MTPAMQMSTRRCFRDDRPSAPGWLASALLALGFVPAVASAQLTPIIGRGATAFDPEISVVNSGEVLDAQAVVSGDMRYVTITTTAQSSRLIALRPFPVQAVSGTGFVGGTGNNAPAAPPPPGDGAGGTNFAPAAFPLRVEPAAGELADPKLLDRRGMIRLSAPPSRARR